VGSSGCISDENCLASVATGTNKIPSSTHHVIAAHIPMLSQGHRSQQSFIHYPPRPFHHIPNAPCISNTSLGSLHMTKFHPVLFPSPLQSTNCTQSPTQPIQWSSIMPVGTDANLFRVVHPGSSHLFTRTRTSKEPKTSSVCQFWTKQEHCSGQPYSSMANMVSSAPNTFQHLWHCSVL
jgi:hypothetical protein